MSSVPGGLGLISENLGKLQIKQAAGSVAENSDNYLVVDQF